MYLFAGKVSQTLRRASLTVFWFLTKRSINFFHASEKRRASETSEETYNPDCVINKKFITLEKNCPETYSSISDDSITAETWKQTQCLNTERKQNIVAEPTLVYRKDGGSTFLQNSGKSTTPHGVTIHKTIV
jgi:hypothetical protein